MIDLSSDESQLVAGIVRKYAPGAEVRVFGSRVQARSKPWSDLDIALMDSRPIEAAVMRSIREAFEESELSFRVDVVDWHTVSEEFRDVISRNYEILGDYTSDARKGET